MVPVERTPDDAPQAGVAGPDWRNRLYSAYVSSGQAGGARLHARPFAAADYPYFQYLVRTALSGDREQRILDLGCGHGALVQCCRAAGYRRVRGIDVSAEQIELARRRGAEDVHCASLAGFLRTDDAWYDVVFLLDVLEHFTRAELFEVLDLVRRRLAPGGRLVIHVPNGAGLFGMRVRYGDLTHEGCFTPRSIEQLLHATGFGAVRVYEDKPLPRGVRGRLRRILWHLMTAWPRLLLTVETGTHCHVLSQNMLVIADDDA